MICNQNLGDNLKIFKAISLLTFDFHMISAPSHWISLVNIGIYWASHCIVIFDLLDILVTVVMEKLADNDG